METKVFETNVWEKYAGDKRVVVENFCAGYKDFLSENKTEREVASFAVREAERHGYRNLADIIASGEKISAGDKVYAVNMDKMVVLCVIGRQPIEMGANIVGAHIDSPRIDIKATPLYESQGFCMLDTHYYGGIKKYQWTAQPLAMHGVVIKKDGSRVNFVFGEDDACVGFTDLLPHLEKDDKKDIKGEDLNLIAGNMGDKDAKKDKFKAVILEILKQQNIEEDDFFSAEIEIVPAGRARDFGLDRSMIMGYGHDDRVCTYTALKAMMEVVSPEYTTICLLVDKEEIGSVGATGMRSKYFENCLAEIMEVAGQYSELSLRRALNRSKMLSSDVTAAFDPNFTAPFNATTDAHLAKGISFNKFTGYAGKSSCNDANPEFIAKLRDLMDKKEISFQATEMGRVDQGGGGTIAYIMAIYGMDVIDAGVPVLNMHAPWEVVSKVDVFEAYQCYIAFFGADWR